MYNIPGKMTLAATLVTFSPATAIGVAAPKTASSSTTAKATSLTAFLTWLSAVSRDMTLLAAYKL